MGKHTKWIHYALLTKSNKTKHNRAFIEMYCDIYVFYLYII